MSAAPEAAPFARRLPAWAIPAIAGAAFAFQLYAFRWGVILPDTVVQYAQVLSGDYADWHPPVTAWLWRWIGGGRFGSAPLLVLDLALFWGGLALIAGALRRRGRRWLALAPLAIGLFPICFGEMAAILKDSLLAACLTAAAGIAGASLIDRGRIGTRARIALLVLLVVGAATRVNAPLAAAPLLTLAMPNARRGVRGFLVALLAAALLLVATSLLINGAILSPRPQHPMLSQVNIDLAGISLASGDNVYPASARPPIALLAACYTPAQFNAHNRDDCGTVEDGLHDLYDDHPGATALWLGAILHHPLAYARHRLAHWNANQRLAVRRVPDDAVFIMSAPNDFGLHFVARPAAKAVYRAATALAWSPLGRPATWLAVALGVLIAGGAATAALPRALVLSSLLYGGGYLVASVAPDLRYNLWTIVAAMLALVLAIIERGASAGRTRIAIAAAPAAVAIAAELIALAA